MTAWGEGEGVLCVALRYRWRWVGGSSYGRIQGRSDEEKGGIIRDAGDLFVPGPGGEGRGGEKGIARVSVSFFSSFYSFILF